MLTGTEMNNADEMIMHVTQIMGEVRPIEMIAGSLAAAEPMLFAMPPKAISDPVHLGTAGLRRLIDGRIAAAVCAT
jgi:hypothetical protein